MNEKIFCRIRRGGIGTKNEPSINLVMGRAVSAARPFLRSCSRVGCYAGGF